jgi:hypothetical protein
MDKAFIVYKSKVLKGFPDYEESKLCAIKKIEHPTARRVRWLDNNCFIQLVDNDMIRLTANVGGVINTSHMSISNFYIKSDNQGNDWGFANRHQVLFALNNIDYARVVLDDDGFIIAGLFGLSKRTALTVDGEIDILNMGENKNE